MLSTKDDRNYTQIGLCFWIACLYKDRKITHHEYVNIKDYIHMNKPKLSFIDNFLYKPKNSCYYWTPGAVRPRVAWIRKHINSLCKQIDNETSSSNKA